MLDIRIFLRRFAEHVKACKSADIICASNASFESWFRVEIFPVLLDLNLPRESIGTNYTYPGLRNKADLFARMPEGFVIFELKSFVSGQDAQKKKDFSHQITNLEQLITAPDIAQVIAFATFLGYSELRMANYLKGFFQSPAWDLVGPEKLVQPYSLFAVIASLAKEKLSHDHSRAAESTLDSGSNSETLPDPSPNTAIVTTSEIQKDNNSSVLADRIRAFVKREYIMPARLKNNSTLTIRAGDVHSAMRLSGRMPAVCSAIGSKKFQELERLTLLERKGPREGPNAVFTFEILY